MGAPAGDLRDKEREVPPSISISSMQVDLGWPNTETEALLRGLLHLLSSSILVVVPSPCLLQPGVGVVP